jgi:molybdopterin/thiamine biosynthesis adenylyltransferase
MDHDVVELSNLNRQLLHTTGDLGRAKIDSASGRLKALNPTLRLEPIAARADVTSLPALVSRYDFVLDCTDSYEAKYAINDACVRAGRPYTHAGVLQYQGQLMTVRPGASACLRCLLPTPPEPGVLPSPDQAGILGAVPGVIGALQAAEAIRFLLRTGELLEGRLLTYDGLAARWRELQVPRDPACPCCGEVRAA